MSPGEKRRRQAKRERERVAYEAAIAALPAEATCATCSHCRKYPHKPKLSCELDSDFHGYAIVKPSDRCPRWARR